VVGRSRSQATLLLQAGSRGGVDEKVDVVEAGAYVVRSANEPVSGSGGFMKKSVLFSAVCLLSFPLPLLPARPSEP